MHQESTTDLLRNGEFARVWERHCGFLDLNADEFMAIQWRLLEEQISLARKSRLWQTLFPEILDELAIPDFRDRVPLSNYSLYADLLNEQSPDTLAMPIKAWMRTSGRGGKAKWVPYTAEAYTLLGNATITSDVLSSARQRGEVRIRPNDLVVHNLPAPPYLSGWSLVAESELIDFRFLPSVRETQEMDFQERNARVFQQAMIEGMDFLGSMTIVLVRMGETFASGANRRDGFSLSMLHPRLLWRVIKARLRARGEGRDHMLPRDLWQPKGIICGGADTTFYRDSIKDYWGVYPYEVYGCTEAGILACQAWEGEDLYFMPATAFYEFIPESAWAAERVRGEVPDKTFLLNEVQEGQRYEVVITSFYGGAFLRYRLHDLVEVVGLEDKKLGIHLPRFRFAGRSGDFIDLSGFAGLIDERQIEVVLRSLPFQYVDWVMAKEIEDMKPMLHLYIEVSPEERAAESELQLRIHAAMKQSNQEYANIESMLGFIPLQVTKLAENTFNRYMKHQVEQGADLAHLKPARIQPPEEVLERLLSLSTGAS